MVLWISLITVAAYFPLRKLFGPQIAALAVLFMAWDPFLIALSRLLHLDGLLASLTVFALLAFLAWLHGGQQLRYFVISGLAAALAGAHQDPRRCFDAHRWAVAPSRMVSPYTSRRRQVTSVVAGLCRLGGSRRCSLSWPFGRPCGWPPYTCYRASSLRCGNILGDTKIRCFSWTGQLRTRDRSFIRWHISFVRRRPFSSAWLRLSRWGGSVTGPWMRPSGAGARWASLLLPCSLPPS